MSLLFCRYLHNETSVHRKVKCTSKRFPEDLCTQPSERSILAHMHVHLFGNYSCSGQKLATTQKLVLGLDLLFQLMKYFTDFC